MKIPVKIQDVKRAKRYGIVVSSFSELQAKSCQKFNIPPLEKSGIRICLESDGTVVDDEFFNHIEPNTPLVILRRNEEWTGAWSHVLEVFETIKKIHPLFQAKEAIEKTIDFHSDPEVISTITTFITSISENREADSRNDDPDWFEDLPKAAKSKAQVMRNGAKSRIRSYFYNARKSLRTTAPKTAFTNIFQPILDKFNKDLQSNDFYGSLFVRTASEEVRLCDEVGWFNCEGPFDAAACPGTHMINPYDNRQSRIVFSTWNLDHQVEKSRSVVPGMLRFAQNVPDGYELNWRYFYDLLFTTANLKLVHIACHKKCEHADKKLDESKVFVRKDEEQKDLRRSKRRSCQIKLEAAA